MPRWPKIALTPILFLVAMAGFIWAAPSEAGSLYRCKADDVRRLGDDGKLNNFDNDKAAKEIYGSVIVDTDTGLVRDLSGAAQWRVIQKGSDNYDFVATPGSSPDSAVTDFIRVRAWKLTPGVTFFRLSLTMVTTGRCEVIR